jgi:hypothetical protein
MLKDICEESLEISVVCAGGQRLILRLEKCRWLLIILMVIGVTITKVIFACFAQTATH